MGLALALMLALAVSGMAQTPTPTSIPTTTEPSPTLIITATITDTRPPTATMVAPVTTTVTEVVSLPILSAVTSTQVMTAEVTATPTITAIGESVGTPAPQTPPAGEAALELTIYNRNLGLVKEVRTVDLQEGLNEIQHSGVASAIDATSVNLQALDAPESVRVLEQFYRYDLASTRQLLSRYESQRIGVRTESGTAYTGTLLSVQDDVILATEEGLQVVKMERIQEFALPPLASLVTQPTLIWLLTAEESGPQRIRVTYLTGGLDWQAGYNAMLSADEEVLSLIGWVTVENQSGASYQDARLKLVAGDIHVVTNERVMLKQVEAVRAAPQPAIEERPLSEFHVYEIPRPVTLPDRQAKQLEFISAPVVTATKVYLLDAAPQVPIPAGTANIDPHFGAGMDTPIQVRLEITNSIENGLGIPLAAGIVRVYQEDPAGGAELIGEDRIAHTPRGEEIDLALGNAFDVVGERTQLNFRQLGERSLEETLRITVRNHKERDIVVRVIERLFRAEDAEILEASQDWTMLDAHTARFLLPVQANAQASITYTVEYRW